MGPDAREKLTSLTTKIKKLKGLKMDEISVRVAQQVAILSERSGWSRHVNLPTDEQLRSLQNSGVQNEPRFFVSFETRAETSAEFCRRWPEAAREIVDAANRLAEGTFDLLGLRELK